MAGFPPRLLGRLEIGRNKVTESAKLLKVCVLFFECLHLTEDAPSAKPNCGLINLLWVDRSKSKLAGVVHWLQVCPVPKCRCPSSQADLAELLGRWEVLVKLCMTHSSLMEKSPPWNFLEQNLVLLRSCFCKSRSCRDDWVEFRRPQGVSQWSCLDLQ